MRELLRKTLERLIQSRRVISVNIGKSINVKISITTLKILVID